MKSHLFLLLFSAALISIVIGLISKETPKKRLRFVLVMFLSLVLFTIGAAWIMYLING
jgi:hypothetical protein